MYTVPRKRNSPDENFVPSRLRELFHQNPANKITAKLFPEVIHLKLARQSRKQKNLYLYRRNGLFTCSTNGCISAESNVNMRREIK